ncbi:MAG: DUF2934 domain-containing protein [Acidobacteriota bacterium]
MTMENLEELRDRLLREDRVQQMVRARAYEIYEMRGGQPGWDSHDWFQAEGEVLAFLIAHESRREKEKTAAETTRGASAPQAPAMSDAPVTKESRPSAASKVRGGKQGATKKTAPGRATSKKPESKPKAKPTRKSSKKESDQ